MNVFAIRNPEAGKELGYFFYYEKSGEYYIELNEDLDEWDCPFILDHYVRRKKYTIGQNHTRLFISQRIVPSDRQNIGMILKDNGLEEYDEAKLFILSDGRCAQDECYIKAIPYASLPDSIKERRRKRMTAVTYADSFSYLISFSDGSIGIFNICDIVENSMSLSSERVVEESRESRMARRLVLYSALLEEATITCSGAELSFANGMELTYPSIYEKTKRIPVTEKVFRNFLQANLMSTQDMQEKMGCSRQNINEQVRKGKITPLELGGRIQVFPAGELYKMID